MNSQSLARGLAFFSLGLGAAELLAPRQLARAIGVDEDNDNVLRALGLRELGSGLGIMQGDSAGFVWSRVGGDVMDLGLLGAALWSKPKNRNRVIGAMVAVAGVAVVDVIGGIMLTRNPAEPGWRVARSDRSGIQRGDAADMRQYADEAMARHQSAHLRDPQHADAGREVQMDMDMGQRSKVKAMEDAATRQFGEGD